MKTNRETYARKEKWKRWIKLPESVEYICTDGFINASMNDEMADLKYWIVIMHAG